MNNTKSKKTNWGIVGHKGKSSMMKTGSSLCHSLVPLYTFCLTASSLPPSESSFIKRIRTEFVSEALNPQRPSDRVLSPQNWCHTGGGWKISQTTATRRCRHAIIQDILGVRLQISSCPVDQTDNSVFQRHTLLSLSDCDKMYKV